MAIDELVSTEHINLGLKHFVVWAYFDSTPGR